MNRPINFIAYLLICALVVISGVQQVNIHKLKQKQVTLTNEFARMRTLTATIFVWQIEDLQKDIRLQQLADGMYQ